MRHLFRWEICQALRGISVAWQLEAKSLTADVQAFRRTAFRLSLIQSMSDVHEFRLTGRWCSPLSCGKCALPLPHCKDALLATEILEEICLALELCTTGSGVALFSGDASEIALGECLRRKHSRRHSRRRQEMKVECLPATSVSLNSDRPQDRNTGRQ
ncbi:hypothetical protein CCHR01_01250 [Colletotrichum chrysophilum]|uniref:Uncharacterized protein n=1 Tax=Colletotrichum chrysophilum TaxID=1836956 RepID=A0AAD9EPG6_9PEZI|nr:hypothetical protein CCHR01_01250 [Colletotrichum chrysophilum]